MKISLITAVYNNAQGLISSLASSLQQTYPHVERIVVDGASKDGTLDVLKKHQSFLDHIISETDQGIYDALNRGLNLATGDIVGILHSDDLFANAGVLDRVAEQFLLTDAEFLYGDLCYVRTDNSCQIVRNWKAGEFTPTKLKQGWMPPHPTVYVRRKLFERFGGYDLRYKIAADYDWMLRLLCDESLRVAYISDVLIHMRSGGTSNRSLKNLLQKSWEDYCILKCHNLGGFIALLKKNIRKFPQFFHKEMLLNLFGRNND